MEIIRNLEEIPRLSLALGFFDGVHIGHQEVIKSAVECSYYSACKNAVVTFTEHPEVYFERRKPMYILTPEDKYACLESLGVDYCIELDFSFLKDLTPEEYLEEVIVRYFSPIAIATGFNHRFGANRAGSVMFLSEKQLKYGYLYSGTPPRALYGDIISSTAIRKCIADGAMNAAEGMLGRKFSVKGTVVQGEQIGQSLGYPTANIVYPEKVVTPLHGVYDVLAELEDGTKHRALANYGVRPTISAGDTSTLEIHIPNFSGDLYGQSVRVHFNKLIRPERKFENTDDLKNQISIDLMKLNQDL